MGARAHRVLHEARAVRPLPARSVRLVLLLRAAGERAAALRAHPRPGRRVGLDVGRLRAVGRGGDGGGRRALRPRHAARGLGRGGAAGGPPPLREVEGEGGAEHGLGRLHRLGPAAAVPVPLYDDDGLGASVRPRADVRRGLRRPLRQVHGRGAAHPLLRPALPRLHELRRLQLRRLRAHPRRRRRQRRDHLPHVLVGTREEGRAEPRRGGIR